MCSFSFQHLEVNFKNLLGIESTSDLALQLLSSVFSEGGGGGFVVCCCCCCFFVIGVGREVECVGATLYVSVRLTCTIKLNIEENFIISMLNFLGKSKCYLT